MRRAFRIPLAVLLWLLVVAGLAAVVVPHFLDRIYYRGPESGHFDGARFFNPDGEDTARLPGGGSRFGFFRNYVTGEDGRPEWPERVATPRAKPPARVDGEAMLVTWIGHATVLIQTQGLNILTDPIWAETAGPFGFGPARVTRPGVALADLPRIDLIVVSHNHYDHMDLPTLKTLWARDRPAIVTSLGNDAILRSAGVEATALDWGASVPVRPGIAVHVTRNHHWGSRWFADRNRALWSSFVVRLPGGNIFFAGDTGYGDGRWPAEATALGLVRLAIIPIGAFRFVPGQMGTGSHIGPIEAVKVHEGLGSPVSLPIHWGTFRLSFEAFDTPPRMLSALMRCTGNDSARFAPRVIGRPFDVPPVGQAPARRAASTPEQCAERPEVQALE
ncbi:Zn-dependent hydrolase [Sphingomonas gilva]|uniref:Zn-dependent hydrolase n=1 Tax=Sphingomonas gilva TaxID=2305907 RepID=A0A396RQS6_9SPHN|nr:MBL fold metallo-hydrolase [Sphingomonas gilva]RHW18326.1 Zn-dependent hydrolase [Sphingomonas gilva]